MKGAFRTKSFKTKWIVDRILFRLSFLLGIIFLINFNTARATMTFKVECPKMFIGKVTSIQSSEVPFFSKQALGNLKKIDVTFKNEQAIKGDLGEYITLQTLENGPHNFKKDSMYEMGLSKNYICSVKKI